MSLVTDPSLHARLPQTLGQSQDGIHAAVANALGRRGARGAVVDVGCGTGRLERFLAGLSSSYVGVDALRYEQFPKAAAFVAADLNHDRIELADGCADIVAAVETIEHLENPRAFMRALVRLLRPDGWLVVTTPNQRSIVSLGALLLKEHFSAFRDTCYPAHQSALLDTDLRRIAAENGLRDIAVEFTGIGRLPLSRHHYPRWASRACPRACSDNVLLIARGPR
jgi:2-polyprenyl-3-methyl-5-hydroxy-6-metoxy-1,4-benzoquinol methylase